MKNGNFKNVTVIRTIIILIINEKSMILLVYNSQGSKFYKVQFHLLTEEEIFRISQIFG